MKADPRVLETLVDVDARQPGVGQREAVVALALERPVHVDAAAVGAHARLVALVVVDALLAVGGQVEPGRAVALVASTGVATPPALAVALAAFVDVDTTCTGF